MPSAFDSQIFSVSDKVPVTIRGAPALRVAKGGIFLAEDAVPPLKPKYYTLISMEPLQAPEPQSERARIE